MKKMIFLSQIFIKFATENKLIMYESIEKQIINRIKKARRGVLFLPIVLWLMATLKR